MTHPTTNNTRSMNMRFPLALDLHYTVIAPGWRDGGTGQTKWIGSRNLAFVTKEALTEGDKIQMSIAWPVPLDDRVALQLWATAVIIRAKGTNALARLTKYEFRTRAISSSQPRTFVGQMEAAACTPAC